MKTLGFNGMAFHKQSGGVGKYILYLVNHLLENRHAFEPLIFLPREAREVYGDHPAVRYINVRSMRSVQRIAGESISWMKIMRETDIGLFHSPISYIPLGCSRVPATVTIHDMCHFHFNENFSTLRRLYLKYMLRKSVQEAVGILSVSHFTKEDLVNTVGVDPDRIHVIHEGIDTERFSQQFDPEQKAQLLRALGLAEPFVLSVGHLEPRKNHERLIEAFALFKERTKLPHKLVIVGRRNWCAERTFRRVSELGLGDEVIFTHFIEEDDLIILFQEADCFITASVYEGFGFTPLESMVARTPVLSSNITSLPEVVGDAAELFDPYDIEAIAHSLQRVLEDKTRQCELVEKGIENLKRFDWERCCRETMQFYEKLLEAR